MGEHTKGPWRAGGGTGCINQVAIEPTIGCAYGAGDEVEANARLISAAPELLEALRTARQELRFKNLTEDGGQLANTAIARALLQVDAAIAKATGAAS